MPLTNVGLRFDSGRVIGSWDIPNPNTQPGEFNKVANDIGFHIAFEISRGAAGVFFIDMTRAAEWRNSPSKQT